MGTSILSTYGATPTSLFPGRAQMMRFFVHTTLAAGSTITKFYAKVQARYNDGINATGFVDHPSTLNDALSTTEIEHAFTVMAGQTADFGFSLLNPLGLDEVVVLVRASKTGVVGDSISVFAEMVFT